MKEPFRFGICNSHQIVSNGSSHCAGEKQTVPIGKKHFYSTKRNSYLEATFRRISPHNISHREGFQHNSSPIFFL
jgi:hypothetical protein